MLPALHALRLALKFVTATNVKYNYHRTGSYLVLTLVVVMMMNRIPVCWLSCVCMIVTTLCIMLPYNHLPQCLIMTAFWSAPSVSRLLRPAPSHCCRSKSAYSISRHARPRLKPRPLRASPCNCRNEANTSLNSTCINRSSNI